MFLQKRKEGSDSLPEEITACCVLSNAYDIAVTTGLELDKGETMDGLLKRKKWGLDAPGEQAKTILKLIRQELDNNKPVKKHAFAMISFFHYRIHQCCDNIPNFETPEDKKTCDSNIRPVLEAFGAAVSNLKVWSSADVGRHTKAGTAFGQNFEERLELKKILVTLFYNMQFNALQMYKKAMDAVESQHDKCCTKYKQAAASTKGLRADDAKCCVQLKKQKLLPLGNTLKFGAKVLLQLCRSTNKVCSD
jgi:hypothetical protein